MNTLYTIGYSAFKYNDFIKVIKDYKIDCIIDVRSIPYSQVYSNYNKDVLLNTLKPEGIKYRNYADEFGANQTEASYFNDEGYLDFEKFVQSDKFKKGFCKIVEGMKLGYIFVLMCAETDPIDCHRNIMIAREFYQKGFEIKNIMKNNTIQSQPEIEQRLLNKYFENRNQLNLFENQESESELIKKAYKLRNKEIGYRLERGNINYD